MVLCQHMMRSVEIKLLVKKRNPTERLTPMVALMVLIQQTMGGKIKCRCCEPEFIGTQQWVNRKSLIKPTNRWGDSYKEMENVSLSFFFGFRAKADDRSTMRWSWAICMRDCSTLPNNVEPIELALRFLNVASMEKRDRGSLDPRNADGKAIGLYNSIDVYGIDCGRRVIFDLEQSEARQNEAKQSDSLINKIKQTGEIDYKKKRYGSGQVINTKIPSHEVATSEKGLPQSMVSITLVSIGREYMGTRIPSHEVATSEQGLPQAMVSITPVSIGREYMGTRIPSHEVATSEKGLPHSRVSITPVSIGREYMVTQLLLLHKNTIIDLKFRFISVANWKGWRKYSSQKKKYSFQKTQLSKNTAFKKHSFQKTQLSLFTYNSIY
ncbi:hypothetical protein K501DRAFT_273682 [Backusella circina FSU 941]|nr:hypothetical protein K501DRAFT_273682 [Backusella circina FSU 941]